MKIYIINGSPRKNGATGKVLQEMARQLEQKKDIEIKYINLSDFNIASCCGCMKCFINGKCIIKNDGIESISEELSRADGIIIGSPTYASNVHGQLKSFIDRSHIVIEQLLRGKYAFAVSTYENAEGRAVLKVLNKLFLFSGGIITGNYLLKVLYDENPFGDEKKLKELHRKTEKLYQAVKNKRKKSFTHFIIHNLALNFSIKPFVFKHSYRNQGVIDKWKSNGTI